MKSRTRLVLRVSPCVRSQTVPGRRSSNLRNSSEADQGGKVAKAWKAGATLAVALERLDKLRVGVIFRCFEEVTRCSSASLR